MARKLLILSGFLKKPVDQVSTPYILIAGSKEEYENARNFLEQKNLADKIIGRIAVNGNGDPFVSNLDKANEAARSLNAKEIVFCAGKLSYRQIIEKVQTLHNLRIRFFAGNSIVGSDDSTSRGEILAAENEFHLGQSVNRRLKRFIDLISSILFLLLFPLALLFVKKPFSFFANCFLVLTGNKTWVGYIVGEKSLPKLREGILSSNGEVKNSRQSLPDENLKQIDYWYARDYEPLQDISIILKNYRYLGG
jgi:hypothetical protein